MVEYITYTCQKCKTSLALEINAINGKKKCPHLIKPKVRCGEPLPNQQLREVIYKLQNGVEIPE